MRVDLFPVDICYCTVECVLWSLCIAISTLNFRSWSRVRTPKIEHLNKEQTDRLNTGTIFVSFDERIQYTAFEFSTRMELR